MLAIAAFVGIFDQDMQDNIWTEAILFLILSWLMLRWIGSHTGGTLSLSVPIQNYLKLYKNMKIIRFCVATFSEDLVLSMKFLFRHILPSEYETLIFLWLVAMGTWYTVQYHSSSGDFCSSFLMIFFLKQYSHSLIFAK